MASAQQFQQMIESWLPGWASRLVNLPLFAVVAKESALPLHTALTGTSSYWEALVICPGLHMQQDATKLHEGEYPACAAMTTGYVFRVENSATVLFLQRTSRTGELTTLSVSTLPERKGVVAEIYAAMADLDMSAAVPPLAFVSAAGLTLLMAMILAFWEDWVALAVLGVFVLVRMINIIVIRRRAAVDWMGAPEPGEQGDMLVLLSQDRWVRIQGAVTDLKTVLSGQWLREQSTIENGFVTFASMLAFLDAVMSIHCTLAATVALNLLVLTTLSLVFCANAYTSCLKMHGRVLRLVGPRQKYHRRRDLADQLIKESGRDDWAVRLGMILRENAEGESEKIM